MGTLTTAALIALGEKGLTLPMTPYVAYKVEKNLSLLMCIGKKPDYALLLKEINEVSGLCYFSMDTVLNHTSLPEALLIAEAYGFNPLLLFSQNLCGAVCSFVQGHTEEFCAGETVYMFNSDPHYAREMLSVSVWVLELSMRSRRCLQNADIRYISELVQKTEAEMLKLKNFGKHSLNQLKLTLAEKGLRFGMTMEDLDGWAPPPA